MKIKSLFIRSSYKQHWLWTGRNSWLVWMFDKLFFVCCVWICKNLSFLEKTLEKKWGSYILIYSYITVSFIVVIAVGYSVFFWLFHTLLVLLPSGFLLPKRTQQRLSCSTQRILSKTLVSDPLEVPASSWHAKRLID